MPKVTIEYTDNIDADKLQLSKMIDEIHSAFGACDNMEPERIMVFAHPTSYYSIQERKPNDGAIIISMSYLSGRTEQQQLAFGKACANTAQKYVNAMQSDLDIVIKAYLREIELDTMILPD